MAMGGRGEVQLWPDNSKMNLNKKQRGIQITVSKDCIQEMWTKLNESKLTEPAVIHLRMLQELVE